MAKPKTKRDPGVLIVEQDEKARGAAATSQAMGAHK